MGRLYIYLLIYHKNQPIHVSRYKYANPMDPMGFPTLHIPGVFGPKFRTRMDIQETSFTKLHQGRTQQLPNLGPILGGGDSPNLP